MHAASATLWSSLLTLAAQGLEIRGDIRCPSVAEITERVGALLPGEVQVPPTDWLELRDVPSESRERPDLEIRLTRAGVTTPLGMRQLERNQSCDETADAVAVIAASWIGNYRTPTPTLPILREVAVAPGGTVTVSQETNPSAVTTASASASAPVRRWTIGTGAAGGIVAGPKGGVAAAGAVEGELAAGARWVYRLTGLGAGSRTLALEGGEVAWQRVALSPAALAVEDWGWGYLQWGGGPVVALTRARGRSFAVNTADAGWAVGIAPTVRFGRRLKRLPLALWIGLVANLWLGTQTAELSAMDSNQISKVNLPAWDAALTGGLTFPFGF